MTRPPARTLVLGAIGAAIAAWIAWSGWSWWGAQRDPLVQRIERAEEFVEQTRVARREYAAVHEQIESIVSRTLGGDWQSVDHQLRTRLNRIGEQIGLREMSVNTTPASPRRTPARGQLTARSERVLRDEIDFVEVGGSITGEGTLEQALRLVHRIEHAPWIKRIDECDLHPGGNGERCVVRVRLTTLFVPGGSPAALPAPDAEDPAGFEPYAALAAMNPFRVPPEPQPEPVIEVAAAPPPVAVQAAPEAPAFPYEEWTVTGVVEGPFGPEVWLLNRRSGESRHLAIGDRLEELELAAAEREQAEFQREQERFTVQVGEALRAE